MSLPTQNICPYINQIGKTCNKNCFYEFCWQHKKGQLFKPCLMNCGRYTKSVNQYCQCTHKSRAIRYKEVQNDLNVILGANMIKLFESQ